RLDDFYVNNARTDGLEGRCKSCQREYRSINSVMLQASARAWYELNIEHMRELKRKTRLKHRDAINAKCRERYDPIKKSARSAVTTALKNGTLVSPGECSHCSRTERIEAHHPDYSKKLEVVWLCSRCHHRVHSGVIVLKPAKMVESEGE
ncbi:MAG: hypothetical protein JRC86_04860, partial [Deltaproteobacteria bacterium]|nr:hypothetical protein [Deltaproteobacteria bacterium]